MFRAPLIRSAGAALVLVYGAMAGAQPVDDLPDTVAKVFAARRLPADSFSAFVQQAGTSAPVVQFNADVPRNPASTIKLVTTFAALDALGPDFRWSTEAFLDGKLDGDTLNGDLLIKGHGDPYLVTERLWLFQRELRLKGLRRINGDLVIDHSYFAREQYDPGSFDGKPYQPYNALPDALLINFQTINFVFRPDPARGRVEILTDPALSNLDVRNNMRLFRGGCDSREGGISMVVGAEPSQARVTFSGALASNCSEYRLGRSLLEAPVYSFGVFKALWEEQGGTLKGGLRVGQVPTGKTPFVTFESLPLAEIIRSVNKFSNNVMTRQIYLTLGAERIGPPGTMEKSRQALDAALARRGLEFPELRIDNGAGLSRDTRISARSMGRLLLAAWDSPYRAEYQASLSVSGVDGTTRKRFKNDPMAGQMHLKTGTLNGVTAIAGYVRSQSGKEYVVVAMHNQARATWGGGQEAQNALLRWVYKH